MDALPSRPLLPRWLRVGIFLVLIMLVQGTLAYLLTWIDPPRETGFLSIRVQSYAHWSAAPSRLILSGANAEKLADIRQSLDNLASRPGNEPVIVYLSAIAVQGEGGHVYIIPGDARPDDPAGWLPLREVLEKLKECTSKNKLLVFEWSAPTGLDKIGFIYHDIARALPGELEAVPDDDRLVLSACSSNQQPQFSDELGSSAFAHYFHQGVQGKADGYGAARDQRVTVRELAAFLLARVDRWSLYNRDERQTPTLHGDGGDFALAGIDAPTLREKTLPVAESKEIKTPLVGKAFPDASKKLLEAERMALDQQLAVAKPADAERLKKRFAEDMRAKLPAADLDAVVFAHVVADPRLDPGMIRLFDQLLHPAPNMVPRTVEGLYLRQLADLAMRVEVQAWPRDLIETFLHAAQAGERAWQQEPCLPDYYSQLKEPALNLHGAALRLWSRGHSNSEDARVFLVNAHDQFGRLIKLNECLLKCKLAADESNTELPLFLEAIEVLAELREPWLQAASATAKVNGTLNHGEPVKMKVTAEDKLTILGLAAEAHTQALQQHRRALHAPFARDAVAKLERQCRSPHAVASDRQVAAALLGVTTPVLHSEDRASLGKSLHALSARLNEETMTHDRRDDEAQRVTPPAESKTPPIENESSRAAKRAKWQMTLLELQGVADKQLRQRIDACAKNGDDAAGWCDIGVAIRKLSARKQPPRIEQNSPDQWLLDHQRYLASDYGGLNLESPGIVAARKFYAAKVDGKLDVPLRFNVVTPVGPLTDKQPYVDLILEVTRSVPPGLTDAVELRFHQPDGVWLDIAPDSVKLPDLAAAKEPRTLTHKIPVKVTRKEKAERTGLPPPLGFLVEAKSRGYSYHHLVTVPIVPNTQDLQILVSADPDEPANTLNEIRVRPGKVKQPHYVYVKNLTNRPHKVYVEITSFLAKAHDAPFCTSKLLLVPPDTVHKVRFEGGVNVNSPAGPLLMRVIDASQKLVAERSVPVEILAPRDYVKVAEATFEPGKEGNNKWAVQVQASRPVSGPAIAAQLVLPVQRIPGLLSIGGGTLQAELPIESKAPRMLFAERLKLVHAVEEEGPVYLHIDGVPRAFVYKTTFSRSGAATLPTPDDRPAVRLVAPPCVMAGVNCLIDVEVDNAPRGAKLEVALGRSFEDKSFKAEATREFADAKKRRIDMQVSSDALIFEAGIADWTATFDTRAIVGPRAVRARLVDAAGKEIAHSQQSLVIDDTGPLARIATLPAQVKKGSVLQVQAQGVDPESGVAQVVFFLGKPDKGEVPVNAVKFKAIPANRELTHWSAALQVPADHKGPLDIGVQVVNHAGMATIDTVTLDVTDREPGKTGLGEIRGKVTEGPRLQPNLLVTLHDDKGKEIARTKTQADGTYVFSMLTPGRYRVVCVKPESQRRAVLDATVEPDRQVRGDLALAL